MSPLTPLTKSSPSKTPTFPASALEFRRADTQKTPPKDLSDLFNFTPSKGKGAKRAQPATKPQVPLARRMLARSRTDPSLDSVPGAGTFGSVISISSGDSTPLHRTLTHTYTAIDLTTGSADVSQTSVNDTQEDIPENSPPRPGLASTSSHVLAPQQSIRTYAGRSRSFLVPLSAGGAPGEGDDDDLGLETRESYADLRNRWGVDQSEDDPRPVSPVHSSPDGGNGNGNGKAKGKGKAKDTRARPKEPRRETVLPPGMMNDLKSITELRSKGESRRFMDEVGYLFEGMEKDIGISIRRGR